MNAALPLGGEAEEPMPPKLDPAALELRGRPPRPIRFRRRVLIAAAVFGSTALTATVWMSLRPPRLAKPTEYDFRPAKNAPDTLRGLPSDYGGVPKLGPPLPGDLGRPILERQRQLAGEAPQTSSGTADRRQQRLETIRAARRSGLLVQARGAAPGTVGLDLASSQAGPPGTPQADPARDAGPQAGKVRFASVRDDKDQVNPHRLTPPASPYMLSAGSLIPASLITGLRSDLPGLVAAQVSENVYDSATGQYLLVPQGARLIGNYDSVVAFGQRRALVVWQRIVLPDGSALQLDNEPATDPAGYAGVADQVDFHTWTLLKGVAISSLLGAGTNVSLTGESDLVEAIRQSAQQYAATAGNQITARNLDIQPSINIRPGFRIRLLVHRDLILAPWSK